MMTTAAGALHSIIAHDSDSPLDADLGDEKLKPIRTAFYGLM
jgi:hypothetical protein